MELVLTLSAARLTGDAVTAISEVVPATKFTLIDSDSPPTVTVTVEVPRLVVLVNVADAVPLTVKAVISGLPPCLVADSVPAVALKFTAVPSSTGLFAISTTDAEMVVVETPSATMEIEPLSTETVPMTGRIRDIDVDEAAVPLVDSAVIIAVPVCVEAE
jgi:hypothetical protein